VRRWAVSSWPGDPDLVVVAVAVGPVGRDAAGGARRDPAAHVRLEIIRSRSVR
jgi:hypothetical protein